MWNKFGEFDSAEEINRAAAAQKKEGDIEALKQLASENGLDEEDAIDYAEGVLDALTNAQLAAIGKLDIEAYDLKISGVLTDWVNELKQLCIDIPFAVAVRRKGKDLAGYIALIADSGYEHRAVVDKRIVDKTKNIKSVIGSHELSIGFPSQAERKQLAIKYYIGV